MLKELNIRTHGFYETIATKRAEIPLFHFFRHSPHAPLSSRVRSIPTLKSFQDVTFQVLGCVHGHQPAGGTNSFHLQDNLKKEGTVDCKKLIPIYQNVCHIPKFVIFYLPPWKTRKFFSLLLPFSPRLHFFLAVNLPFFPSLFPSRFLSLTVETTLTHSQNFQSTCSHGNIQTDEEYLHEITLLHDAPEVFIDRKLKI